MHNDLAVASKLRREASRHLAERFQFIRFQQSQRPFLRMGSSEKSSAADAGAFPPIHRFGELEIHKVLLRSPNLASTKNLSPSALADFFRASLLGKL